MNHQPDSRDSNFAHHLRPQSEESQGSPHPFFSRIFLPFAVGYFLSHLFRSVNAIVFVDLVTELGLDAWILGWLTSAYFVTFAAAQIPVGIALDRFGPHRTEAVLLSFAAAGAFLFSISGSVTGLVVGRALIGLGVSACLMASFQAFILWAPSHRVAYLNGAVMAIGAAGSLTATAPVEWAVSLIGWRRLFLVLSLFALGAMSLLWLRSPRRLPVADSERLSTIVAGVSRILQSRVFWSVAPLSVAHQGSYLAIQSLWAGPWLRDVARFERGDLAATLLTLALGMGLGYLGIGYLAQRLAKRGSSPLSLWLGSALLYQLVQIFLAAGWTDGARGLWFAFGFFGASGMLSYVLVSRCFPVSMAGRVNTGLNLLVFTSAFALQAGIGAIIQSFPGDDSHFSPDGYRVAFGAVVALQTAAAIWLVATRSWRNRDPSGSLFHRRSTP